MAPALSRSAEELLQTTVSLRNSAEHDMKTVYMESLPDDASFPRVGAVVMVKSSGSSALTAGFLAAEQAAAEKVM